MARKLFYVRPGDGRLITRSTCSDRDIGVILHFTGQQTMFQIIKCFYDRLSL